MAPRTGKKHSGEVPFPEQSEVSDSDTLPQDRLGATSPSLFEEDPPPYGDIWGQIGPAQATTGASIAEDGRVNIRIDQNTKGLSSLLVPALRSQLDLTTLKSPAGDGSPELPPYAPPSLEQRENRLAPPPLNLVVHVVGSRGDVQPFVALGKVLKEQHHHRVRIATHPVFQDLVEDHGLEFFSIGGDPSELMAYMVRNPGLMPGFDTLRSGDVGHRRQEMAKMIKGCWRSCFETGDGTGADMSFADPDNSMGPGDPHFPQAAPMPFVADAIIANPPSFAHIHCAEKLGIPLHMMFTMPWSPTQSFPHPLANIQATNAEGNLTNFMSYALVDMMTWQGLGDIINRFREKSLGLEPVSLTWAPGMLARLHIPYTYCWSPALIPKPKDWASYISISGFFFLSKSSTYTPDPELVAFLEAGPPPVYIGFGSIVVDDPNGMTKLIFDAVRQSGQRALVSKGWGGFGAEEIGVPDDVFMVGNVPHDWLFEYVSCVVHHGGAGTTAAGIACGKPTVIVPFFGDQPFWGAMVSRAGIGPKPIPSKELTSEALAAGIGEALKPEALGKAGILKERISQENGSEVGAQSFHQQLSMDKMRCHLSPNRAAVWRIRRTEVRLSAFAAAVLSNERLLDFKDLKLYRPTEYDPDEGPIEPISGGASALIETMASMAMGIADLPVATLKALKIHPEAQRDRSKSNPGQGKRTRGVSSASKQSSSTSNRPDTPSMGSVKTESDSSVAHRTAGHARSTSESSRDSGVDGEEAAIAQQVGREMAEEHRDTNGTRSRSSTVQAGTEQQNKFSLDQVDWENALRTGKGAARMTSAAIKSPMDFTLGLAKGFHNAPKLYGDDTVRKQEKVTNFSSGLRAAGRELGYGFYDGISGLVTQPLAGAKKEGAAGFVKGFGKGIGGVVFKPGAAIWGVPGYTSMGIYREIQKRFGPSTEGQIIASRTAQGYAELRNSSASERAALIADWKEMRRFIRKKQNVGEEKMKEIQDRIRRYTSASEQDQKASRTSSRQPMERTTTTGTLSSGVWSPDDSGIVRNPLSRSATVTTGPSDDGQPGASLNPELEKAIRASVAETSQGDAEQDASIERAIRASLVELEEKRAEGADEEEIQRAMQASLHGTSEGNEVSSTANSQERSELDLALKESKEAHAKKEREAMQADQEEEIVMRYVMKQSKLEEQAKQQQQDGAPAKG